MRDLRPQARHWRARCGEGSCPDSGLGGGITLYCGPDTLRFDSAEELAAHVPPLAKIDGFRMTFFANPLHLHTDTPFVSLYIGKAPGEAAFRIMAEAATQARAQELALEIAAYLPASPEDRSDKPADPQNAKHGSNRNQRHYGKFFKTRKAIGFIAAAIGLASSIVTIALAWPAIIKFFCRLFHIQQ